jgi:hypothetical protein
MLVFHSKFLLVFAFLCIGALGVCAQSLPSASSASGRGEKEEMPKSFKEMLSKQRVKREKQEHEELLKRGDEAAELTLQLEEAFTRNNSLSPQEQQKLEDLEKIVTKIRKELGGDDDEGEDTANLKERRPSTIQEAFINLKETTLQLVSELKKTSRFTVSALAIQSSNTVLKLVHFLRLRR